MFVLRAFCCETIVVELHSSKACRPLPRVCSLPMQHSHTSIFVFVCALLWPHRSTRLCLTRRHCAVSQAPTPASVPRRWAVCVLSSIAPLATFSDATLRMRWPSRVSTSETSPSSQHRFLFLSCSRGLSSRRSAAQPYCHSPTCIIQFLGLCSFRFIALSRQVEMPDLPALVWPSHQSIRL